MSGEAWSLFKKYFTSVPSFEALAHPCQLCMVRKDCSVEVASVSPENSLRRVHWISLVGMEGQRLPSTSTDVWLSTFCHVANSCCPHHMAIVVPFKEGTVPGL